MIVNPGRPPSLDSQSAARKNSKTQWEKRRNLGVNYNEERREEERFTPMDGRAIEARGLVLLQLRLLDQSESLKLQDGVIYPGRTALGRCHISRQKGWRSTACSRTEALPRGEWDKGHNVNSNEHTAGGNNFVT